MIRPRRCLERVAATLVGPILVGLALVVPRLAAADPAAPPLVTDRPLQTFSARTVPAGSIQSELGFTHSRVQGTTGDRLGEWFLRWGVWRDFELNLLVGSYAWLRAPSRESVRGWSDGRVGLKWTSQHGAGPRPTAALLLSTSLPIGQEPLGEDTLQPDAAIAMEWAPAGGVILGSNLGWAWASQDLERFHRWRGSLALKVALGRGLVVFVEGHGFLREEPGGSSTGYLDAGLTLGLTPAFQLDARAGVGRNGRDEDWLVGVGAAWRMAGP